MVSARYNFIYNIANLKLPVLYIISRGTIPPSASARQSTETTK
nr:MAG TPA: hypothetical protein [Bacteriophage sp.]